MIPFPSRNGWPFDQKRCEAISERGQEMQTANESTLRICPQRYNYHPSSKVQSVPVIMSLDPTIACGATVDQVIVLSHGKRFGPVILN